MNFIFVKRKKKRNFHLCTQYLNLKINIFINFGNKVDEYFSVLTISKNKKTLYSMMCFFMYLNVISACIYSDMFPLKLGVDK